MAGTVCLLTLTGCALWCAAKIQPILLHADGALTRLEGIESKANATLVNLDNGTKVWAASAKEQSAAVEDLAIDAHGTLSQVDNLAASLNKSADDLHGSLGQLNKTIDAATGTAQQATADLATLNGSLAGVGPLVGHTDAAVADLDALLKDEALHQTIVNVDLTTASVAGITGDLKKVSDKLTYDFVTPKPWYRRIGPGLSDLWDYGALVARHTP